MYVVDKKNKCLTLHNVGLSVYRFGPFPSKDGEIAEKVILFFILRSQFFGFKVL